MEEKDGCGVGFVVSLKNERSHQILKTGLLALARVEHRGGVGIDGKLGDGAGIMTTIPFELFNREPESFAVASLLIPNNPDKAKKSLQVFEETFWNFGLKVVEYRDVPINPEALSSLALSNRPQLLHAIIDRPDHCRTINSFEKLLYQAKQMTRSKEKENGIYQEFYFNSLSARTIVYKALSRSEDLPKFYLDLQNPQFKTNFVLFHRRYSTNTLSSWDKVQPFRLIAHNGEINTIEGNQAWGITREKSLGLRKDELVTHDGISDSGSLNGMVEALKYRSSLPSLAETMAILMPPADSQNDFYRFWSRGMEPWDGPALVTFCDGKIIGARLDRNGFRPCRWMKSKDHFYLCSEVGVFDLPADQIEKKGALSSGENLSIHLFKGQINFADPKDFEDNSTAQFFSGLVPLKVTQAASVNSKQLERELGWFNFHREEIDKIILPMALTGKEPLGSMGDTAALAILSDQPRSLFDFFYQDFAQVTNPPLDYLREKMVTDLRVYIGRKPNIFEPKEFIPPKRSYELPSPILGLEQMEEFYWQEKNPLYSDLRVRTIDILFPINATTAQFEESLNAVTQEAIDAIKEGISVLILTDKNASDHLVAIPSLLAMSTINLRLNETGRRMRCSLVLDVGDARTSHQVACLIGHGATAICPRTALGLVRSSELESLKELFPLERQDRYIKALNDGILKIMSKMGISVLRSYQGSRLFTSIGLSQQLLNRFFPGKKSSIGGLNLDQVIELAKRGHHPAAELPNLFLYREQSAMKIGERHSLTSKRSRLIHEIIKEQDFDRACKSYQELSSVLEEHPLFIRHLFGLKSSPIDLARVEPSENILKRFGTGAMSFGAISAEAQRDLILAMRKIGGHSNSGEGGENPFHTEGISANIKQLASGRFGVTAEYLVSANEVQIKIAQGAKPGEGGQLMGVKVGADIAKARYSTPGVDLISPPPQHDIYSIEDLRELIDEIKALHPQLLVSVKLVSGRNIGAIAIGVAKAGADIIQVSGGDGGTGAAGLLSMKHAGLPMEIGLWEVHTSLTKMGMRSQVKLRADGGFLTAKDLVIASCLGADQFDFGKLALVSEGCVMARVCEKNTCPAGIATQDPRFKDKYKGRVEEVVRLFEILASQVRSHLAEMGHHSLFSIIGRGDLLELNSKHLSQVRERGLELNSFFEDASLRPEILIEKIYQVNGLNAQVLNSIHTQKSFNITNTDRAIPASLYGQLAWQKLDTRLKDHLSAKDVFGSTVGEQKIALQFIGSAGQGFGVFNSDNVELKLIGEANDSVAKAMSSGKIVIVPPDEVRFLPQHNSIIGNCALYGATGGTLYVHGRGGDRFAVRNSGAIAIIDSVGLHACEYMTGGVVWIVDQAKANIAAGMTGGTLYLHQQNRSQVNWDTVREVPLTAEDRKWLISHGQQYFTETSSLAMKYIVEHPNELDQFVKLTRRL